MRPFSILAASLMTAAILTSAACSSEVDGAPAPGEGGGGGDGGSGAGEPVDCDAPQTSCPSSMPFPGGACEGDLSCEYTEDTFDWTWICNDGVWNGAADCSELLGGACPQPPPAESCSDPFEGEMAGEVHVGPVELGQPFRDFEEGEEVDVVWGGQGSAMVFYRLTIDGDEPPSCAMVEASLTAEGMAPEQLTSAVTMRCGESLRLYLIVPIGTCMETEPVDTVLDVTVQGVGSTSVTLRLPPDAFCGGFG